MNRKKIAVITAVAVLALTLNGCGNSTDNNNTSSTSDNIEVADNQRLAYAMVSSIDGNEMTYMEVDESKLTQSTDENTDAAEKNTDSTESTEFDRSQMKGQGGGRGTMPGGSDSTEMGTPPDMGDSTEMGTPPDMGDSTEMGTSPDKPQMSEDGTEMMPMEEGSTEGMAGGFDKSHMADTSVTVQVPVGVTVHTASDTTTTFSRIASGDVLKILFETDDEGNEEIVEIWMVQ